MNAPARLSDLRILVVEDEMMLAMAVEDEVEQIGCEAVVESHLGGALARAAVEPLHGALLDINLRGELSWAVAEKLVEREIPFIFMTGYSTGTLRPDFRERPILSKPFTIEELERTMAAAFLSPRA